MAEPATLDVLAGLVTPFWLVSAGGGVVWCNESARTRLGMAAQPQAPPQTPEMTVRWDAGLEHTLADLAPGQRLTGTLAFRTTTPTAKKLHVRCSLLRLERDCGVAGAAFLAEAIQAETRTGDLLAEAFEQLPVGIALFNTGHRLVSANRRYRDLCDDDEELTPDRMIRQLSTARPGGAHQKRESAGGRLLHFLPRPLPGGGAVLICTEDDENADRAGSDLDDGAPAAKDDGLDTVALIHHLSHELRTPLNAVIGFSEIIADDLMPSSGAQRYQDYAGEIRNAAAYMLELINNLLDLARLEAGQVRLDETPCDLVRLIALTVRMVTPRAKDARVPVVVAIDESPPLILGDTMLIRQMLTNLVVNAIKFSAPVGGRVEIRTERDDGNGLAVVVRDTGIGMRPDQIPLALRPFYQVHCSTEVPDKGSGLGLPLTNALIARHGGRMTISSAPGAGTEVRLVFPPERLCCGPAVESWSRSKPALRPLS